MDHHSLIFSSVFPVPSLSHTTPTPVATPDLGYAAPGQSFGSPHVAHARGTGQQHRAVKRNIAWSTATRKLSLPRLDLSASASYDFQGSHRSREVEEALTYLLVGEGRPEHGIGAGGKGAEGREEGLLDWYISEMRLHFASFVRPGLARIWAKEITLSQAWDILEETQSMLQRVHNFYLHPFLDHILPFLHGDDGSALTIQPQKYDDSGNDNEALISSQKLAGDIHAEFAHSLPSKRFSQTLSYILYDSGCRLFGIYSRLDGIKPSAEPENVSACRQRMVALLQGLEKIGLGGDNAQKAFAHAMDKLLDSFIASHYTKVDWFSKKSVVPHVKTFIAHGFCPLVELVMECLRFEPSEVQATEQKAWQDLALGRLGRSRVENLFDFVINWDKSLGAILDIKEFLKVAGGKQYLTTSFSQQVSRRLLHPGATTTYVLNVYISIIRAFRELEPKGVLLERVARPIRRHLKEREDTARIIISSLLTDIDSETGSKLASGGELSHEIALEMQKPFANFNQDADEDLNWGDLNWQPLPTDASPDYKKSKVEDVIWFLLTLLEREEFINELKNILGDHLLRCQDPEYTNEIRVLELIKVRLGDDKLQACEVMLRDVLDSKRINTAIRASDGPVVASTAFQTPDRQLPQTPENAAPRTPRQRRAAANVPSLLPSTPLLKPPQSATLNAQILSSFFWPLLRDDHFLVPAEIQSLQKDYETRFERIKGMRKLRWMNALGDGTVTLELEDRTENFKHLAPWQVSVIYAFQPQPGEEWAANGKTRGKGTGSVITRNVQQLEEMLEMDEALVRQSLAFWVGQSILRETSSDTFEVIETLSSTNVDTDAAAAAQELAEVTAQAQAGAVRSQADLLNEKKDVYCSFILGMLTNQGNMPVQRILMMMRMMVQGGFPFGNDEVKALLEALKEEDKVVEIGGNVWGIRK